MRWTVSLVVLVHICTIQPYDQASDVHLGVLTSLSNLIPVSSRLIQFPERGHSLRNSGISTSTLKEPVVRSVDSESAITRGIWGTFWEWRTDKAISGSARGWINSRSEDRAAAELGPVFSSRRPEFTRSRRHSKSLSRRRPAACIVSSAVTEY